MEMEEEDVIKTPFDTRNEYAAAAASVAAAVVGQDVVLLRVKGNLGWEESCLNRKCIGSGGGGG